MIASLLVALIVLLVAAKLGGAVAEWLGQPAVLGELLAGVLLSALPLAGIQGLAWVGSDQVVQALADLGVILLLFEVGLATRLADLVKVGVSAFLVALVGVLVPMVLGCAVSLWLLPGRHPYVALFLGATLCATSVGITARVLKDMNRMETAEAQIVLGAAVIDDVMGLVVLAVVAGLAGQSATAPAEGTVTTLVLVTGKAIAFLVVALALGRVLAPILFRLGARLKVHGVVFTLALVVCFGLSWLASIVGLAPLVGAFAAGLILEGVPFDRLLPSSDRLEDLLFPLSTILVPLFFVRMGLRVSLPSLGRGPLLLALALTVAAVVGKQACGLAVVNRGADRLAVGLGMIPRGEVGLIFAGMGRTLSVNGAPLLGASEFGAVVTMVMLTTIVTPPLLRWRFRHLLPGQPQVTCAPKHAAT
ncbi:MAG TPA: cation:proton antiporter [Anaeromyxobacteraceae bacterium]|nr:cation:proton antiporter [Anaeromyxobacteraceae bacterium]